MGDDVVRLKLDLSYDGSGFRGFAANEGVRTVQGELNRALGAVLGGPVVTTCAGRTDAGVHATGQVVSLDAPSEADPELLARSLNAMLGPDIAIDGIVVADPDFDARFGATGRRYRYSVLNSAVHRPLLSGRVWHVPTPLDVEAMNQGAAHLVGLHDFASFCRRQTAEGSDGVRRVKSTMRHVRSAQWRRSGDDPDLLDFEIAASAFCHQMVRSIVGTLVRVGRGRLGADEIPAILEARDRTAANQVAPPSGLVLEAVSYDAR